MRINSVFVALFLLSSCANSDATKVASAEAKEEDQVIPVVEDFGPEEFEGLVDVRSYSKEIYVDLKYATEDNFMSFPLYDRMKRAYLQPDVAQRLAYCQSYLSAIDNSKHLLIYDAARPVSVQKLMWDALDTVPAAERGKYVSNPVNLSLHNLGCAVDVTICNIDGVALDMGAGFDDFRDIAFPNKEAQFLKSGELTKKQHENRLLLRKVMASQNFRQLPTEWWHYNAYSRDVARKKFGALQVEPH
ncbi:MAG: M15 family metallopeptidase [Crocinitomicaceae bacterium]|jgi:D-alanyl-D-alanine dipeptidase|tara:strand:+ start:50702 stop:51439 length:738 start_codon:yes stop_codon:yes gene_type:complete